MKQIEKIDTTYLSKTKLRIAVAITFVLVIAIYIRFTPLIRVYVINYITDIIVRNTLTILIIDVALYIAYWCEWKKYHEELTLENKKPKSEER